MSQGVDGERRRKEKEGEKGGGGEREVDPEAAASMQHSRRTPDV